MLIVLGFLFVVDQNGGAPLPTLLGSFGLSPAGLFKLLEALAAKQSTAGEVIQSRRASLIAPLVLILIGGIFQAE